MEEIHNSAQLIELIDRIGFLPLLDSGIHGFSAEDVKKDLEGLQTMRNLARNMAFLIRAIQAEKEKSGLPEEEHTFFTSFPDGK